MKIDKDIMLCNRCGFERCAKCGHIKTKKESSSSTVGHALLWWLVFAGILFFCHRDNTPSLYDALIHFLNK